MPPSSPGLPAPVKRRRVPRVITFQRKRANRRIVNEAELLQLMSQYGAVRVVEFNSSTPFAEQLRVMQETGVFVSAHTSNLANAVFLQPGSAVVEIIQVGACDRMGGEGMMLAGRVTQFAWELGGGKARGVLLSDW